MPVDAMVVDTKPIEKSLTELVARTRALVVVDQATFITARQVQKDWDAYIANVGLELDGGIGKAKATLDHLKDQKAKFVDPAKLQRDGVRQMGDDWASEEKRKAKAEEERINAQRRADAERKAAEERKEAEKKAEADRKLREKEIEAARKSGDIKKKEADRLAKEAAEDAERKKEQARQQEKEAAANVQPVSVAPSVPKVAGFKDQTYYYSEVLNPVLIIAEFAMTTVPQRRDFLRRFIQVNEQEVGKFARDTKNPKVVEAALPGVHAWSKG